MSNRLLQLTLAILKPHVVSEPNSVSAIRQKIIDSSFKIVRCKSVHFDNDLAAKFYNEHAQKFFYNRLVTFMSSGRSEAYVLAAENAIATWREIMGPTKVYKAFYTHPNTIRGLYGLSDTRNVAHGSDSENSFMKEVNILFPEFNIEQWYLNEEPSFRNENVKFSVVNFIHYVPESFKK